MTQQVYSPSSSAIGQILYDDETGQCVVIFTDGARYTYTLPQDVFAQWIDAASVGGFYNANIGGQFAFAA